MQIINKGSRFGKLEIIKEAQRHYTPSGQRLRKFICMCDCGNVVEVLLGNLKKRPNGSCGCEKIKLHTKRLTKHGKCGTPTYKSWVEMKYRCSSDTQIGYKNYKGRGITHDVSWNDFEIFLADMGERPKGTSLDRIDNDGNYCKDNCRWASKIDQMNNTRRNKILTYNGEKKTIAQWEKDLGFSSRVISQRLQNGWSVDKAISTPLLRYPREVSL